MQNGKPGMIESGFWKNKKVFITGHTGFKGSWLCIYLHRLGAIIKGYALAPNTTPSLFELAKVNTFVESEIGDIRDLKSLESSILSFNPEIIIHMAAQPLVRQSYKDPIETFETNVMGTSFVMQAAIKLKNLKVILNITTDKCYLNNENNIAFKEDDPLGGYDPYSASKACSEIVTHSYRQSFYKEVKIATARAGNVIGGGDWSTDRLLPDILKSLKNNQTLIIRSPKAVRPWQHVLEPISVYANLTERLYTDSSFEGAWNIGPEESDAKSVEWILNQIKKSLEIEQFWKTEEDDKLHEAKFLRLDTSKLKNELSWKPSWNVEEAIEKTLEWNKRVESGQEAIDVCHSQIQEFVKKERL